MLAGFQNARAFGFGDQHLDLFFRHGALALRRLPKQPEHRLGRDVEQPDRRSRHTRQRRHQWRDGAGDALGMAQRQVLGHQLANDQRQVGDCRKDDDVGQPVGDTISHATVNENLR